jgi:hypothetical protein
VFAFILWFIISFRLFSSTKWQRFPLIICIISVPGKPPALCRLQGLLKLHTRAPLENISTYLYVTQIPCISSNIRYCNVISVIIDGA